LAMSFSSKTGFTATWAHVVVGDIFVTRWIWKKSLEVPMATWKMRMSIFFGVMLMPLGLLLHALFTNKKK
jgi:vacuolar-type H+-ATPase subunit I/STV1